MEPQHARLLRPRSQGRDPAQMGRRPRRKSHRHGSGETDQRDGGERKKVAVVSPVPAVTGHELRENYRSITEIHRRQALRQLILSSFCFLVASMASAAEPGI